MSAGAWARASPTRRKQGAATTAANDEARSKVLGDTLIRNLLGMMRPSSPQHHSPEATSNRAPTMNVRAVVAAPPSSPDDARGRLEPPPASVTSCRWGRPRRGASARPSRRGPSSRTCSGTSRARSSPRTSCRPGAPFDGDADVHPRHVAERVGHDALGVANGHVSAVLRDREPVLAGGVALHERCRARGSPRRGRPGPANLPSGRRARRPASSRSRCPSSP